MNATTKAMDQYERDLEEARDTNRRLNRRVQKAEAALFDSKRVIDTFYARSAKGTPWCGGSLGRGFLVWENSIIRKALRGMLDRYVSLVNCGDCGNWNPEKEQAVIDARAALGDEAK